jgi:hypothetical protein
VIVVTLRFLWAWSLVSLCAACGSTDNNHTAAAGGTDPEGASGSSSAGTAGKANAAGANTGGAANTGGGSNLGGNANAGSAGKSTAGAAGGNSVSEGPGTITATWEGYCVATFTEDYLAKDPFGAPLFTALKGEQYLVIYYPEPPFSAKIAYLTSTGPYSVDVAPNAAQTGFPFTTQCPVDEGVSGSYFAVFADVSVYAEPALTNKRLEGRHGAAACHERQRRGLLAGVAQRGQRHLRNLPQRVQPPVRQRRQRVRQRAGDPALWQPARGGAVPGHQRPAVRGWWGPGGLGNDRVPPRVDF